MGNNRGYEKGGKNSLVDTNKMTLDQFWSYINYLLEEVRLIEKLKNKREKSGKTIRVKSSIKEIDQQNT